MGTLIAIPTRSNWKMLSPLLSFLKNYDVVIYDNGHTSEEGISVINNHQGEVVNAHGWKFYRMWNDAWKKAHEDGYESITLLNDDIELHENSIEVAQRVLMDDPTVGIVGLNYNRSLSDGSDFTAGFKQCDGSYRKYGIWGCAFLVKSNLWGVVPPIDEGYNLWYGDDELFENTIRHGYRIGIALGAPVLHYASTTASAHPELLAMTVDDAELFYSKFNN